MRNIVFEITDNEQKVIAHYCHEPQEWVENAVRHLVELAKDEIYEIESQRIFDDPDVAVMSTDRDAIVSGYGGKLLGNPNQ